MKLTEEQLLQNWNDLMLVIDKKFEGERKDKLTEMYTYFRDRMMFAPASGFEHLHNCFIGGYVDHVLRVIKCAEQQYMLWQEMGSDCSGYTMEELIFVALNHDLGKVGDLENDYYEPCTSEWHRKNQGRLYDSNKSIGHHMPVPHRSIFLLNHFGIKISQVEMIGILTHDGLYDDGNKTYLMICAGAESFIGRTEGFTERCENAYHYYSRGTRGLRVVGNQEEGNGFHHIILDAAQYGWEAVHCDFTARRWKMTGLRYGLLTDGAGCPSMIDCSVKGLSGLDANGGIDVYQAGGYYHNQHYRGLGRSGPIKIVKNDFEYDAIKIFGYLFTATWDNTENAWLFKRYRDSDNSPTMEELVYLPAGTTMRVTAKVKLVSGFSGTYPYLGAIATTAAVDDNSTGNAANDSTIFSVARVNPQFTSAAASAYEEKQLTVGPFNFPVMMKAGIFSNNRNASEGYYIKDFRIYLDPPYANPRFAIINDGYINPYRNGLSFKNNFDNGKVRLGGRLA